MFCENCGCKLEPGSTFCSNCGAPLPVTAASRASAQTSKRLILLGGIAAAVVIIVVVCILCFSGNSSGFNGKWQGITNSGLRFDITDDAVTFKADTGFGTEQSYSFSYTERSDSYYRYLILANAKEIMGEDTVLVLINDDMLAVCRPAESYSCSITVDITNYSGKIDAYLLFAREGTGTNEWPLSASKESMLEPADAEYIYYPSLGLLVGPGIGLCYVHNSESVTPIEEIGLLNAQNLPKNIPTNHNFCITDWH